MLTTEHKSRTVQDLADLEKSKKLNLSPAFQRNSVWSVTDRRLLVQSLFDGMPLPTIYLYRRVGHGGTPVYDVIDGKQRLETILLFMGKGPLAGTGTLEVKTAFDPTSPTEKWTWSRLDNTRRHAFLSTVLPIIEVQGDLSDIVDLFVRINSTGKRLDGQEKRHAKYYSSPVLKAAQKLADGQKDFLVSQGVLSSGQVQRMKHVELMTELLLAVNAAGHLNKKAKIDEIIRGDSLDAATLNDAAAKVTSTLKVLRKVLPDLKTTRFRQSADFYSLVLLLQRYKDENMTVTAHDSARNTLAGELLRKFGLGVDMLTVQSKAGKGVTDAQQPFLQYSQTVKEGTDSAAQRKAREKLLRAVLDGVFDDRDPVRTFNPVQRRVLWHGSPTKACRFCGKSIPKWENLAIDHVQPHVHGGATTLANGALAHSKCNASAGAKG